jgi:hypothetical protein
MWRWRKIEKIIRTDRIRNEEVLHEERNMLQSIKRRTNKQIGYILPRRCLLKEFIEGNRNGRIDVTGRRGIRRKKQLDDNKETRG